MTAYAEQHADACIIFSIKKSVVSDSLIKSAKDDKENVKLTD